ncbi:hypothetical protein [Burkholderia vietnamiensis]|uniref:hypothetical protein n=1 Tax=Burkholderia vietnamiensis TaxID=60552 RepID=UPI001593A1D3|nr:hypothetical protein [Burkholderia vietnamiensis]
MTKPLIESVVENPPPWAHETIHNWAAVFDHHGKASMDKFVTREIHESHAAIDMREVIGQDGHYAGQTWLEAVIEPQRKPENMRLMFRKYDDNPSYYFTGEVDDDMYFSCLNGGPWFCDSGGNHRTVVAKFACDRWFRENGTYPLVKGVLKYHYFSDLESLDLFRKLQKFENDGLEVKVERQNVRDSRADGKHILEYEQTFFVADHRFSRDHLRSQWLSTEQFRRFARHVIQQDGKVTRRERLTHYWLRYCSSDDPHKLIFCR